MILFRPLAAAGFAFLATPALADLVTLTPEETAAVEAGVRFDIPDAAFGPFSAFCDESLGTVTVCGWAATGGAARPFIGTLAPDMVFYLVGIGGAEGTPTHQATAASCEEMGAPLPPRP